MLFVVLFDIIMKAVRCLSSHAHTPSLQCRPVILYVTTTTAVGCLVFSLQQEQSTAVDVVLLSAAVL